MTAYHRQQLLTLSEELLAISRVRSTYPVDGTGCSTEAASFSSESPIPHFHVSPLARRTFVAREALSARVPAAVSSREGINLDSS